MKLQPKNLIVLICATLLVIFGTQKSFAASHTWSGAVNGLFSNAGNWSSGGVPTLAETNSITFPSGTTRFTVTNDIGALKVSAFTFSGSGYILRGAGTITMEPNLISFLCSGATNTIESPLSLASSTVVSVPAGDSFALAGQITGAGGLVKFGDGKLFIRGSGANSFSDGLSVSLGYVYLQKTGGATALPGPVTVGSSTLTNLAYLIWSGNDQISGAAAVTVNPSGGLYLESYTNSVDSVTMWSGSIQTYSEVLPGPGLLRMSSGLTLGAYLQTFPLPDVSPIVRGTLEFLGASGSLYVSDTNVECDIEADIVEYGSATILNKTGPGTLGLKGGGNFTGAFNINQGRVIAYNSSSLGAATAGTTVTNGATLEVRSGVNSSEPLSLTGLGDDGQGALQLNSGTATLSGTITITNQTGIGVTSVGGTLNLDGPISGNGGIRKFGDGTLSLNGFGNNTFSGASFVDRGRLTLNKGANVRAIGSTTVTNGAQLVFNANEQMDNAGVLTVYGYGNVNLTNRNESIGGLNLGGNSTLDTGSGTLTLLGNVYVGPPYSTNSSPAATIRGNLSLGGSIRTLQTSNTLLALDCAISDGAGVGGFRQEWGYGGGDSIGGISLLRSNSFTGPAYIFGVCYASNSFAFGAPSGGVWVTNTQYGSTLRFLHPTMAVNGETLTTQSYLILASIGTNAWNGPVVTLTNNVGTSGYLESDATPGEFTINGSISGPGSIESYNGLLRLTASNSFKGTSWVSYGTLAIQHPNALGATNNGTTIGSFGRLKLELPDGATVTGESLTFGTGFDGTTNDNLTVAGAVSNNWNGPITTTATPTRISVLDFYGTLVLNTAITGGGSLAKSGLGALILAGNGSNQLSQIVVEHGALRLAQTGGYALPSGNVVVLGDELLYIDGVPYGSPARVIIDKPGQLPPFTTMNLVGPSGGLVLNDNLTVRSLSGSGEIYISAGTLTLSNAPGESSLFLGAISGYSPTNLIKDGDGSLLLHGPSFPYFNGNYDDIAQSIRLYGAVLMQGGYLSLSNGLIGSLQLASGTTTVTHSAPVAGGNAYVPDGLSLWVLGGSGNLSLTNGARVYLGSYGPNSPSVFNGLIDGFSPAQLVKTGTNNFTLTGNNTYFYGNTLVQNGNLFVNGVIFGDLLVQAESGAFATLSGTGMVQNVTVTGIGSRISPGSTANTPSYGHLLMSALTLGPSASYQCEINGTNAGMNLDQLEVNGNVILNGGFANFMGFGAGVVSNRYAVIKSTSPISGIFSGDPEGDIIFPSAGRVMKITYLLAGGKEVNLIEQAGAPLSNIQISSITRQTNGTFTINGTGVSGATYFLEANTNLNTTNWISLGSILGSWDGGIHFTDVTATNVPQCFYRIRLQ